MEKKTDTQINCKRVNIIRQLHKKQRKMASQSLDISGLEALGGIGQHIQFEGGKEWRLELAVSRTLEKTWVDSVSGRLER